MVSSFRGLKNKRFIEYMWPTIREKYMCTLYMWAIISFICCLKTKAKNLFIFFGWAFAVCRIHGGPTRKLAYWHIYGSQITDVFLIVNETVGTVEPHGRQGWASDPEAWNGQWRCTGGDIGFLARLSVLCQCWLRWKQESLINLFVGLSTSSIGMTCL